MSISEGQELEGSAQAVDIYVAVGVALSYWEGSEDIIMGIYKTICRDAEPSAFEAYVASPRSRRNHMLKDIMRRYPDRVNAAQSKIIIDNLKALDRLSSKRNEIAHGHCSQTKQTINGRILLDGFYLVPSLNEAQHVERSFRYVYNAEKLNNFTEEVRRHRGALIDVMFEMQIAMQNKIQSLSSDAQRVIQAAHLIVSGVISEDQVLYNLIPAPIE